jgi:L-lactate dehydrogenase
MSADYTLIDDEDDITNPHDHHDNITYPHDDVAPDSHHDHRYSPFDFDQLFGDDTAPADQSHFDDDVYRAPPSAFFDHILNPAGLAHARYSPFAWRPYSPLTSDMPPTTRAHPQPSRPDRLANGYVDLTSAPDSPPPRRKRQSPTPGPSAKRQKRDHGSSSQTKQQSAAPEQVDELDLTEQKTPRQDALQKPVKAQAKPEETVTTFNSFNCVICMDNPTDLTATACGELRKRTPPSALLTSPGHLFCHTCLMEALIAGENRTGPHETKRSQCPVCRKTLSRNKASDVIPLLLKKGLATQPRKKVVAPAAAPAPKVA